MPELRCIVNDCSRRSEWVRAWHYDSMFGEVLCEKHVQERAYIAIPFVDLPRMIVQIMEEWDA